RWPRLIYCSVSGFGQTGPKRRLPGYDAVVQAEGGLMSITGSPDGTPSRLGVAIADIASGMFAAQGVTLALLGRQRTGRGQRVDVAMLDSVAALLTYQAGIYFTTGTAPQRMGNRHPTIVPYETFEASDGVFVVAVGNDEQWKRFCSAVALDALAEEPTFQTNRGRVTAYDELRPRIAAQLRTRTRQEWIGALTEAGVPCGSVRDLEEVLTDPQLLAREMVTRLPHPVAGSVGALGTPIKLSDTPGRVHSAPPTLGQHTEEILERDLGLHPVEIARLKNEGVV
ncbi:MAG TPA: CaiB/BaiF CoA-transferase family protein, partial [Dehalococcoidia bacterium]|nr:CaiB/BaiF CoA-transferase family protein [Dehalococcoidia bacterium]